MSGAAERRAVAELRWEGDAEPVVRVGGRSLHQYWAVLAPYFRDVLLAPHRRTDENAITWSWREARDARAVSAGELAALRARLGRELELLVANLERAGVAGEAAGSGRGGAQLPAVISDVVEQLMAASDEELAARACRTTAGVRVHSWGTTVVGRVRYPDTGDEAEAGPVRGAAADESAAEGSRGRRRRRGWIWVAVAVGGAGMGVWGFSLRGGSGVESANAKAPVVVERADGEATEGARGGAAVAQPAVTEPERKRRANVVSGQGGARMGASVGGSDAAVATEGGRGRGLATAEAEEARKGMPAVVAGITRPNGAGGIGGAKAREAGGDGRVEGPPDANGGSGERRREDVGVKPAEQRAPSAEFDEAGAEVALNRDVAETRAAVEREETRAPDRDMRVEVSETEDEPKRVSRESPGAADGAVARGAATGEPGAMGGREWSVRFPVWELQLLRDEVLPTMPRRRGEREEAALRAAAIERRRGGVPASLREGDVQVGVTFETGRAAGVEEVRVVGMEKVVDAERRVEVELREGRDEVELRGRRGDLVARVRRGGGGWSVWAREGVGVAVWCAARTREEGAWRAVTEDVTPAGWTARRWGEEARVERMVVAGASSEAIAWCDRASGWAWVGAVRWARADEGR